MKSVVNFSIHKINGWKQTEIVNLVLFYETKGSSLWEQYRLPAGTDSMSLESERRVAHKQKIP